MAPWLPRLAAAAVLMIAIVFGGRYAWNVATKEKPRTTVPAPAATAPPQAPRRAAGSLHVTSTPTGARVVLDGKLSGITPLTLNDVNVGRHVVELRSDAGTVERSVNVSANTTTEIDTAIFSGFVGVYSPFEVVVSEGGRALRLDEHNQIMLAPGRHELHLSNRALGYETDQQVDVTPGEMTKVTLTPPPSTLSVTASEAAEVWVDGVRVGETPLTAHSINLGTHDVVVRRLAGGERRFTATVTVKPFTISVDFSQP